ncbi:MAG: hypothetical protein A2X12_09875 [Bacteroidetes bacterium GWE2_29_8]|nr:MAG: hypothetical protein A2X12_09875 [Bacteroidetes bacterium GWE2_29_8]OFY14160.1 MAG: hypothetical protein A2X02_02515 [Bacteroidetes bacterium GWF2_29_10]
MKIAIASGKGGTGKTFVSTNLFYTLYKKGNKVTLIDCDAEEPNAKLFFEYNFVKDINVFQKNPVIDVSKCTFCGKCHEYCNYNSIFILPNMNVIKVIEDLCHGCGACKVACKFDAITEKDFSLGKVNHYKINDNAHIVEACLNVGISSPVPVIKRALKEGSKTDNIILLDSPPGTSCPFIQTSLGADYILLVTEPTPFGLSDLKQAIATLKILHKPFGVVINRSGIGNSDVKDYLEKENIQILLDIPFDRDIASIYSKGNILAKERLKWFDKFSYLFDLINNSYGNSSN